MSDNKKRSDVVDRVAKRLTTKYRGRFAAIDPKSGEFFIGVDALDVALRARKEMPHTMFEFRRLGFPFTHIVKIVNR